MAIDSRRHIDRDRHARGLRGPLLPHNAPIHSGPDAKFQARVRASISELDNRLGKPMKKVTFKVEAVPSRRDVVLSSGTVPLGRIERGNPDVVVLYQRAIELRSSTPSQQMRIVKDVLAELLGLLFSMDPRDVDPLYEGPSERE